MLFTPITCSGLFSDAAWASLILGSTPWAMAHRPSDEKCPWMALVATCLLATISSASSCTVLSDSR